MEHGKEMIKVVWGSSKHYFKDMEELEEKYPKLNNRPPYIMPEPPKDYKRVKLNTPINYSELSESRIIHYCNDVSDVWINAKKDL